MTLIVSFYTPDYADHADRMRKSCIKFGYRYWIEEVSETGSWVHNCAFKGVFIANAFKATGGDILWLDADAQIVRHLTEIDDFPDQKVDIACYRQQRPNLHPKLLFRSGTLYIGTSLEARTLVTTWAELCEKSPDLWDQETLLQAWSRHEQILQTRWLPLSYCQRLDEPGCNREDAHVLQHQASRQHRRKK